VAETTLSANLVGEKNLEYGVDENAAEIARLLGRLGIAINLRFVRGIESRDVERLGFAAVNILREPALRPVGEDLERRLGTPCVDSFPVGLAGTCRFLEEVGRICGIDASAAVEEEQAHQAEMLSRFDDIAGSRVDFQPPTPCSGATRAQRPSAPNAPKPSISPSIRTGGDTPPVPGARRDRRPPADAAPVAGAHPGGEAEMRGMWRPPATAHLNIRCVERVSE